MKYIIEKTLFVDRLIESSGGNKNYYIEGIFLQSEMKNANGRWYPKNVMDNAVKKYISEKIETNTSVGELNHPSTPRIDYERVTHKIVSLKEDGNNYIGRAIVADTNLGKIVKALLDIDVTIGVSSRGLGSVSEGENGLELVGDDFWLATIDIVSDPSAHDAFVTGIQENCEYLMENGVIREIPKKIIKESKPRDVLKILANTFVQK